MFDSSRSYEEAMRRINAKGDSYREKYDEGSTRSGLSSGLLAR